MKFLHYIALSFGLFMAFIIMLVVKTYHVNNELVAEDYYKQELEYQNKLEKMSHVKTQQQWQQTEDMLVLAFPEGSSNSVVKGTVDFYRPSDASKDVRLPLALNEKGEQVFPKKLFAKGLYNVKLDWKQNGVAYYSEKELYLK